MQPPDAIASSDQDVLKARLAAIVRRLGVRDLLTAAAAGALAAAGAVLILRTAGTPTASTTGAATAIGMIVAGAAARRLSRRWTHAEAARVLERQCPDSRNLIVTAEELLRHPDRARPWIRARVAADAAGMTRSVRSADVVPARRAALMCVAALAALSAVAAGLPQRAASLVRSTVDRVSDRVSSARRPPQITATIIPPDYLGAAIRTLDNPARIEAIEGSRLSVAVAGAGRSWNIRLGANVLPTAGAADGAISAEVSLSESSYLAIEERGAESDARSRALIPVVVVPDRTPTIRIEQPGRDLLLPDARADVRIGTSATDDFGLSSLELRFTKVSGSGEQYEFEEGTIPLALQRESARSWKGSAALALSRIGLQAGDALVYRVVGRDGRRGDAGLAASESFFVEIAGPGQVTLAGFELPPERERYALSQQMIVLKIERLRAREESMAREDVAREMADIAAEQRAVRANFIFLTGGHVEDEEQEAEHSHEIQEGRLAHSARREISSAIQFMSRAEQALVAVDTAGALPPARAAVEALQRAFGRSRYFLRTMPVRSRIDPSRRLTGALDDAADSTRPAYEAALEPAAATARRLVAELLDMPPGPALDARRLGTMAEQALAVDAGAAEWQEIASALLQVRDAVTASRPKAEIQSHMRQAFAKLLPEAHKQSVAAIQAEEGSRALRGAWAGERRQP